MAKRFLFILSSILLSFSLAACGANDDQDQSPPPETNNGIENDNNGDENVPGVDEDDTMFKDDEKDGNPDPEDAVEDPEDMNDGNNRDE